MPLENGQHTDNLTVDELRVIEGYSRHYAEHAARRVLSRYVAGGITSFLILAVGLVFAIGIQQHDANSSRQAIVHSGRVVSVDGCNRDFRTITALRGMLTSARIQTEAAAKKGQIPASQADQARQFYKTQLAAIKLPDCRVAYKILTDDPDKLGAIPTPLYVHPKR